MLTSPARRSRIGHRAVALVLVRATCSCTIGPDYRRPDVDVPSRWWLGPTEAGEISNVAWWDQFQDPVLSGLVRTALANNKDLAIATANIDQAAAQYGIVRSRSFRR
jgi:multidrug efflux system outer membrane protein